MKKRAILLLMLLLFCSSVTGLLACSKGENADKKRLSREGYTIDEVTVHAGLETPVKLIMVNDAHVQAIGDSISSENKAIIDARIAQFSTAGLTTAKRFEKLCDTLSSTDASLILFAGDIADFSSPETAKCIKEGFEKLSTDYMYLREDHDFYDYWQDTIGYQGLVDRQTSITELDSIYVRELEEIVVAGINFSHSQIGPDVVERFKAACDIGKPVIVVMHVPIDQKDSSDLKAFSEETRNGELLYWGQNTSYKPNQNTSALLDLIYEDDSPVVAVLAAHLHGKWEGPISKNAFEHVFAPLYEGNIGIITID